jgi:hypothetical protein
MAKETLSAEVQAFIVQALACFDSPSIVAVAVKQEFGLTITRQLAESYDPTKRAAKNLAAKWKTLFDATRKTFLEDTSTIAVSHRAVRLRALQRMADKAETQGNTTGAAALLEQVAKEMGNAFTNTRVLSSPGGGAAFQIINTQMTPKEAADAYADALRGDG